MIETEIDILYKEIMDYIEDAIFLIEINTLKILYMNSGAEKMTGYSKDEIKDMTCMDVIAGSGLSDVADYISSLKGKQGKSITFEAACKHKNGKTIPVEIKFKYLESGDNRDYFVSIARNINERKKTEEKIGKSLSDFEWANCEMKVVNNKLSKEISERRKIEKELERSNKELEQFAYIASHDLKAPLRAIKNLSTWIAEDLQENVEEDTAHNLELMKNRVNRMEALIDGLLEYSRVGRKDGEIVETDIGKLLNDTIFLLAPPKGFDIRVKNNMPHFKTLSTPLQIVFRNLINNAIKHHDREDGRVDISFEESDNLYKFSIADDGPGIPENMHEKVFEIFNKLKPNDEVEGCGMGLALVKKIVENYGGSVNLESGDGKGAVFLFTWPKQIDRIEIK